MLSPFKPLLLFLLAGLCEIGGGYLMWQWLKAGWPSWTGVVGGLLLVLYGVVATWQTTSFGKTYAVYGGVFIILSIVWAWYVDGFRPDRYDVLGGTVVFLGIGIILFWPRS
ncbi:YnfA family protein [Hymenobacter coalescens]